MVKSVKLFVEAGGNGNELCTKCRAAFSGFLDKSGLSGRMPRIVASGSRESAYEDYCAAVASGENAVLLIDSETRVITPDVGSGYDASDPKTWRPWHHLKNRKGADGNVADGWDKPAGASDEDCHLMVESMETWFLADARAVTPSKS